MKNENFWLAKKTKGFPPFSAYFRPKTFAKWQMGIDGRPNAVFLQ
jgi:hypothetical protein